MTDLDTLEPGELEELADLLREKAARGRRRLTTVEAQAAWDSAPVAGTGWETSQLVDVGRIRLATCRLILDDGWKAPQIVEAMFELARFVCGDVGIAREAIAAGIADAKRVRGV